MAILPRRRGPGHLPTPSDSAFRNCPCRKELGNPDTGHSYPSLEELKNIWIPHAIKMRLTKSKELDVCNWSESDEVEADDTPLGLRGRVHAGLREQNCFRAAFGGARVGERQRGCLEDTLGERGGETAGCW